MALVCQNQKARDLSQKLLVATSLSWAEGTLKDEKKVIIDAFIKRCMSILNQDADQPNVINTSEGAASETQKKAVMSLLSLFLNSYEGIKELKPEQKLASVTNLKPFNIDVVSMLEEHDKEKKTVLMSGFQTIGHMREKIAAQFGLAINEFNILIRENIVDPDIDDDKYLKDVAQHLPKKFLIQRNLHYEPTLHPKNLLAKNENFSIIFSMLRSSSP